MHFKKQKPKAARGGPKWNKPWKLGRTPTESPEGEKFSDHKRRKTADPNSDQGDEQPSRPDKS
ncbi:hypothetical protein GV827_17965 [Sulfitobacter sp. JBTF-M27]|uniref:Uncharacterized protein n=1 Tax=Sulfitobacter sediminilitoris TaxID=2698830 RepID=A0A6P0CIK1_9RHOB|nr:hypothetical protein [Sulfitobacter sediminilitoris]NEK24274.1 hypothetical protein [Sulfitobacter sediminilitoris]